MTLLTLDSPHNINTDNNSNSDDEKTDVSGYQVDQFHSNPVRKVSHPKEETADDEGTHPLFFHFDKSKRNKGTETCSKGNDDEDQEVEVLKDRQES